MLRLTRRRFLQCAALASAAPLIGCGTDQPLPDYGLASLPPLRTTARRAGILYGAAVSAEAIGAEPDFAKAVARECSIIVPQNSLKWEKLRASPDQWNFAPNDVLRDFAKANGMKMRGHTLVWHINLPRWVQARLTEGSAAPMMEEHIDKVVGHYRGKIIAWDVVNEAVHPEDGEADGLRATPWFKALGPAYIEQAYRLAHKADPAARLIYNDYGPEWSRDKGEKILALLRRLKDKGVPLHGVGLQGHIKGNKDSFNPKLLRDFCRETKRMGLEFQLTEFDIDDKNLPDDYTQRDAIIAERTKEYLETILAEVHPTQILTWGLSDRHSWMADYSGRPVRSLPLDRQCRRKPMWQALHDCLAQAA